MAFLQSLLYWHKPCYHSHPSTIFPTFNLVTACSFCVLHRRPKKSVWADNPSDFGLTVTRQIRNHPIVGYEQLMINRDKLAFIKDKRTIFGVFPRCRPMYMPILVSWLREFQPFPRGKTCVLETDNRQNVWFYWFTRGFRFSLLWPMPRKSFYHCVTLRCLELSPKFGANKYNWTLLLRIHYM